jgi:NadR type nicotinamide-nucleotide adenylyltransferase
MKKIVVIGPECTGKSTLTAQLAAHYGTVWCPEFAREYLVDHGTDYTYDSLLNIATGQIELEEALLSGASRYYFIDTDLYVMKVWCEVAFDNCHSWILKGIATRRYDMYFLCDVDLPWVQDGLREYPDPVIRRRLFKMYKDLLINSGCPWEILSGTSYERLHTATGILDTVFP